MLWISSPSDGISSAPTANISGRYTIDTSHFWTLFSGKCCSLPQNVFPNLTCPSSRYEIEYDQNRLEISKDIGRRFLGFDIKEDGTATAYVPSKEGDEDVGGGGDAPVTINNSPTDKEKLGRNILRDENGVGEGPDLQAEHKLVLDVLNDELVERVREKMLSGSKDLFELCQIQVKAFLAGEPFQEFEHSMYFHR